MTWRLLIPILLLLSGLAAVICGTARGEEAAVKWERWTVTAYCPCRKCTDGDGITASGKRVKSGMIALNWMAFGTQIEIRKLGVFIVEDRGSRRHFGTRKQKRKRLDIYMPSHKAARQFGRQRLWVKVMQKEARP